MNCNAMPTVANMTLTVHMLINGKEILPQAFHNEEAAKGVLTGWMNVEPNRLQALNETIFLATFAVGILAEEIGTAIERIDNWLGKPIVITCNEVTVAQLPHVLKHVQHMNGVDLVVFNYRTDDLHSDSLQSVQSGHHNLVTSPVALGAVCQPILKKIPGILQFSGTEREKDTVQFEQWYHAISDACKNFNEQLVRAAITRSCVGVAADAMCCLPPGATLDNILEKFKWLYGSVESSDTLMQEFYCIAQGQGEKVQTFVFHFRKGSESYKTTASLWYD